LFVGAQAPHRLDMGKAADKLNLAVKYEAAHPVASLRAPPRVPQRLTSQENRSMDPVVHFEFPYDNRERIIAFYQSAFGWQLKAMGEDMGNYVLATTADPASRNAPPEAVKGAINGGFYQRNPDWPAQVPSVVIAVQDIKASMDKVKKAGGEVLGDPMEIPGVGQYVSFFDTEKNRVSLLQPKM
jgi:predicted enzyme related to lactoylglutathione lyase